MTRQEAEQKLKSIFGFEEFYDDQWKVIEKIFLGQRVLVIEKTGFGKSLCFQFPATQFEGLTIVFSPLVALMRDQVNKLQSLNIPANLISYQHTDEENIQTLNDALEGKLKILYIHPQRMENLQWLDFAKRIKISMIVVDEAHCISTWGHDFIPAYQKIVNLVNLIPINFPVLATTATATKRVELDIVKQIGKNISTIRGNLLRENLNLYVVKVESEEEKLIWIGKNLERLDGTGVIYTGTRVNTEIYSKWLEFLKVNSVHYNAGIDTDTKKDIENSLMNNQVKCVVSTNALGMGIDKPDIRFIIHTQTPVSPIHYYQEIGRAGRDNQLSRIVLFYNPNDDNLLPLSFIEGSRPSKNKYEKVIGILKSERLGIQGLVKAANLKQNQIKVILADLIAQNIIVEVIEGRNKKYEYKFGAPNLNTSSFDSLRNEKLKDFNDMLKYINLESCRMEFLCNFLGDQFDGKCGVCDNCRDKHLKVIVNDEWKNKLKEFFESYFPILEVEDEKNNLRNGVASSFYGFSNVGNAIHRCKYENGGDFPDWLLILTLKAYHKNFSNENFDLILYIPPTESGDLVKNFAVKLSKTLNIPISHNLKKIRRTLPQKIFESKISKKENLKDAFCYDSLEEIHDKSILIFDDIFDSGATIKEISKYLIKNGAKTITPLVIAKTIGGMNDSND